MVSSRSNVVVGMHAEIAWDRGRVLIGNLEAIVHLKGQVIMMRRLRFGLHNETGRGGSPSLRIALFAEAT